jgi:LysM repeat protein
MKTSTLFIIATLTLSLLGVQTVKASSTLPDSIGVENRVDKSVVLHKVKPNETIYSILRKYRSTLKDYHTENPDASEEIQVDQVVRIPLSSKYTGKEDKKLAKADQIAPKAADKPLVAQQQEKNEKPVPTTKPEKAPPTKTEPIKTDVPVAAAPSTKASAKHTVEAGQTLFSIAKKYGVSVDEVKRWNNLADNTVKVGQVLTVATSGLAKVASTPKSDVADTPLPTKVEPSKVIAKADPIKKVDSTKIKETKKVAETPASKTESESSTSVPTVVYRQVKENGMAGLINVDDKSGKYLALHRSAPAGTLIQVRNEANNRSVFVKVIGKLPDTGLNDKLVIKVSPSAFEKLSPVDRKFRAELTYMKAETVMTPAATASNK